MVFKTLTKETRKFDDSLEGTEDYDLFPLNNLEDGETFMGKPVLANIRSNEFEDQNSGEMVQKWSATLSIVNHDNEEILRARLNLKGEQDEVTFWENSLGYDIIDSIEEMHEPGSGGQDNIYNISFKELQEYINNLNTMSIRVVHHTGKFEYNTFRITGAKA